MAKASILVKDGKHEKANEVILQAIDEYPDSAECFVQLGGNYYFTGNLDKAITSLNKALKLDSSKMEAYKYRGMILHRQNKPELAEKDYIKFLKHKPNDSLIILKSATCLFDQGKLELAENKLKDFNTSNLEFVEAYYTLGAINEIQREFDECIIQYTKAISLDPTDYLGYYYRARILYEQGKAQEACADLLDCINNGGFHYKNIFDGLGCVEAQF